MSMTSHDYNDIADAIKQVTSRYHEWAISNTTKEVVEAIAETLEANNDNFDRVVFLSKAGVEV